MTCWPPSPCTRLSRARTTTRPPPRPQAISRHRACPPPRWKRDGKGRPRTVPTFTAHRSARSAPSYTPAASPRLRRRLSARPPHRLLEPAPESTRLLESGRALHPGPYPPDLSRRHRYGASTTDSLALRLLTLLAGPGPSGSTGPSRRCRGCSRPPRRSPDQAASSFTRPLRRPGGGALPSPHEYTAPRGAPSRWCQSFPVRASRDISIPRTTPPFPW